ncbi:hypothetical protein [Fibrella forsythiae]|uniref:Uncharacterized protein n=1 Tax=Fibrella forsythiae TaxID=2817061 RepID=A0ABS3JKN7_9BACT|nr:hypothetical protein [Fibrella forsythiae]MBO0950573.1 hypothetical protein [Fibrella forsythiae]
MSQTDDKPESFPKGYEHTEARLDNTQGHLQAIDEQIKNTLNEQGPTLTFRPPGSGFMRSRQPGSRDQVITFLEERKNELKRDTLEQTEQDTRGGDNKAGRVVRDRVREELFPNPYRHLGKAEMGQEQTSLRDMEQAQDYMDAKLVQAAADRKAQPKEVVPSPEKKEDTGLSMSVRFNQSLSYTKAMEQADVTHTPPNDPQRGFDRE